MHRHCYDGAGDCGCLMASRGGERPKLCRLSVIIGGPSKCDEVYDAVEECKWQRRLLRTPAAEEGASIALPIISPRPPQGAATVSVIFTPTPPVPLNMVHYD